jgi:hypothetical protein
MNTVIDVDGGLAGCDSVWTCSWVSVFQRSILNLYLAEDGGRMFL